MYRSRACHRPPPTGRECHCLAGVYNLPDLPPETYRLEIEKTGFKKLIKPDVVLPVQDALEIDFEMTVGSVTESITVQGGTPAFNPAAFTAPPTGQQGSYGHNVLRGFGAAQADVAFQRQSHFTDKVGLRFRSEFFNLFNHPNFGPPDNTPTNPLFGQSTLTLASSFGAGGANGGFNPLYQIGSPRSVRLALKLQF